MSKARANGIELEYEEIGDAAEAPMLLIMGLGAQMVQWPDGLCRALAGRGFRVIRFDNRDIGLSTKFDDAMPDPGAALGRAMAGENVTLPYTLGDMADDAAGLLDALGIASAHIVGASMGGMIAQRFVERHPEKTRSLTSIMSTTGDPSLPQAAPEVLDALIAPVPAEPAAAIEQMIKMSHVLAGGGFPFDEAGAREQAERVVQRHFDTTGPGRQLLAIVADGSRREALDSVHVPTLVIHGTADPLVLIAGGRDTAEHVPGAQMLEIEGMGHELPEGAWGRIVDAIARLAGDADGANG